MAHPFCLATHVLLLPPKKHRLQKVSTTPVPLPLIFRIRGLEYVVQLCTNLRVKRVIHDHTCLSIPIVANKIKRHRKKQPIQGSSFNIITFSPRWREPGVDWYQVKQQIWKGVYEGGAMVAWPALVRSVARSASTLMIHTYMNTRSLAPGYAMSSQNLSHPGCIQVHQALQVCITRPNQVRRSWSKSVQRRINPARSTKSINFGQTHLIKFT